MALLVFGGHFGRHLGFHTLRMFRKNATLIYLKLIPSYKIKRVFAFNKKKYTNPFFHDNMPTLSGKKEEISCYKIAEKMLLKQWVL